MFLTIFIEFFSPQINENKKKCGRESPCILYVLGDDEQRTNKRCRLAPQSRTQYFFGLYEKIEEKAMG